MYLKSLTLKGFKSFADRTVMKFEPGLAAIVGPNGSGKSNISDAVLWVLGERNAKNLRGQSMEDVIFAGSSARKPVSVAEVELLLDNSDGTLPVEFDEVSIGRRMYRSGESEYLVNGNVVRRMDVLDILHDSGLGTGTNSIISQGNLDSILSSKPEDRRALIEEAAGILKHKERRQKSERKLAQMDNHLNRVNDITAEVERQLKPLERKAKRALTYKDLAAQLADLKLHVAVDDLRQLQKSWDSAQAQETELTQRVEVARKALTDAEEHLDSLQQQLQTRGIKENNLNETHRRAESSAERLNSTILVLREKRRQAQQDMERFSREVEESKIRYENAHKELASVQQQAEEVKAAFTQAQEALESLDAQHKEQVQQRNGLRRKIETLTAEQRGFVHKIETIQATQEALRDNLNERRARAQVIAAHVTDAQARLEAAQAQLETAKQQRETLEQEYDAVRNAERTAREEVGQALSARDSLRAQLDDVRSTLTQTSAERTALEEMERAAESSNPALTWVLDDDHGHADKVLPLSHVVKAQSTVETLVEALLGDDIHALTVKTSAEAKALVHALYDRDVVGEVVLWDAAAAENTAPAANQTASATAQAATQAPKGTPLMDLVEIDAGYEAIVATLLGDVVVVDTIDDALALVHSAQQPARFATAQGFIAASDGRMSVIRYSEADKANSALARHRKLEQLRHDEAQYSDRYDDLLEQTNHAEETLRTKQTQSLQYSEQSAQLKGRFDACVLDHENAETTLNDIREEYERLQKDQQENEALLEQSQPDADNLAQEQAALEAKLQQNKEAIAELEKSVSPIQRMVIKLSEQLSQARLEVARLSERSAYADRMVQTRKQEIESATRTDHNAQRGVKQSRALLEGIDPLLKAFGLIDDAARLTALRLEEQSRDAKMSSQGLHAQIAAATRDSREKHDTFDRFTAQMAELRVEKGRLEVQVEAAIKVIVEDCNTSLETAMKLPELEERQERAKADQKVSSLERRIKNLGTINPDAADDYEQVKERYEYLISQLEDMKVARQALSRIVDAIDNRMKDDFIDTFNQVNDNFSEIFETLFPGGHAFLTLTDPDDLETTGVDVNAQPEGKRVKKMSLLSGGEKSMTAMALLFAVYRIRQTPFYILDEVEAALDDTNLRRLIAYLNTLRHYTQFIMITHQRRTMESADILYGVSMQADGVTKVLSQRLENAQSKEK